MVASAIFCVGVIVEFINTHSRQAFYVGRVTYGLGLGGSSVIVPIYMSEMSPKEVRGRLGSSYWLMFTSGILASYWADFGVKKMPPAPDGGRSRSVCRWFLALSWEWAC